MAFNFAQLLSAACGGAPRRLGRLRRTRMGALRAPCFLGVYQHQNAKKCLFETENTKE